MVFEGRAAVLHCKHCFVLKMSLVRILLVKMNMITYENNILDFAGFFDLDNETKTVFLLPNNTAI